MKKLIVISILFLFSVLVSGQELPGFHATYESAFQASKDEGKLLMIDFYTSWCKPCKKLDKEVYGSEEFFPYTEKMACVKVDFESEKGARIGKQYDVSTFPTVVFVDSEGREVERITSYFAKSRYMNDVKRIVEGKNTIGAVEARYPDQTTYEDLFQLSFYFGRRYYNKEKRNLYHNALLELDPGMKNDSTVRLTNVLYQAQLMYSDGSDVQKAAEFINKYPNKGGYQAELMLKIVKYLDKNDRSAEARNVYEDFATSFRLEDKQAADYLKEAKKLLKD